MYDNLNDAGLRLMIYHNQVNMKYFDTTYSNKNNLL